ncbi:MAG: OprD family outer membrane porin [Sulfuricurvum sp.]|uniref:OprD family outer membrane porin n=1 Tax=Sulfuricurvum sp. TaxID=2025608 RepID=UPI00261BA15A|nr:OprD family outer membrane porin [Sulfuricurvum sp.]MDD2828489.1 OprD family outer membrane porin [Sulfuricurvum sp.]MDD4948980.1 OprD family outer membrane porin [Sulfuricurvum sp.]
MRKTLTLSIITVIALNGANIDEAFKSGKASGQLRTVYLSQDNAIDTDTYGTSLGGILKYESGEWNGLKLGVAAYISQKVGFATGDEAKANNDLFANNAQSYAYVGEAYADYTMGDLNLKIGRQLLDTPFAQTDDIRMHPNTFEAAIATYSGWDKTTLIGGYVKRFAGYDSGDDISKFKRFDGFDSKGVTVLGIMNESIENFKAQGWMYGIDNMANAIYADAIYSLPLSETMGLELSAQAANFSEKSGSGLDGNVYGIATAFNYSALRLSAAYNTSSSDNGKVISNGFGGGPYFTSMEEMTIDGYEDAKACQLSAELDLADAGIEGLKLSGQYGTFKSTPMDIKVKEVDFIATYAINEALSAEMSYAMVNDKNKNTFDNNGTPDDGGYDRLLVRLSYNF